MGGAEFSGRINDRGPKSRSIVGKPEGSGLLLFKYCFGR